MEVVTKKNISELVLENIEPEYLKLSSCSFAELRRAAFKHFFEMGFPTRKNEEYKYSTPEHIFRCGLSVANKVNVGVSEIVARYRHYFPEAKFVVIIDGYFSAEWSDARVENVNNCQVGAIAKFESDYFAALNTMLFPEVVQLKVDKDPELILIINISAEPKVLSSPRVFIHVPQNIQAGFVEVREVLQSANNAFCNLLVEIKVEESARVNYYRFQHAGNKDNGLSTIWVTQEGNSFFDTNSITLSGGWIRNNLTIELKGTSCEANLNGLLVASNAQLSDNHTLVDHQAPNCKSNQTYKAILKDKSVGIFNGKIYVRRNAQKTNAYQSSKNILLSDDATMNAKPQLEIFADDVRCSHGSSTGKIDKDALFYLKTRGIGEENAKILLLMAFANDVINTLNNSAYKNLVSDCLRAVL